MNYKFWKNRKCKTCGKWFYIRTCHLRRKDRKAGNYCSLDCKRKAWKKDIFGDCLVCKRRYKKRNKERKYCSRICFLKAVQKGKVYKIKTDTKTYDKRGYVLLKLGVNKYEFEHRVVWRTHHGCIPKGWIIHHLNGVKDGNRIENLMAMPRKSHSNTKLVEPYKKRIKELEKLLEIYNINRELKEA